MQTNKSSTKKRIKLKCSNGISFTNAIENILFELREEFEFEDCKSNPEYIIFGPYGNDFPQKGNYTRIGYFCENIVPDLSICEWAFGVPLEEEVNNPRYKRIQWHGLNPKSLIKPEIAPEKIAASKPKFCNFIYSHKVPYREEFFRQLSKYKKVDSPGKSMNNMPSFDSLYEGDIWNRKRKFLSEYKFTIAFENYVYPGYQTEKLYDAMLVSSLPIYCGDPNISEIFNKHSFINVPDYVSEVNTPLLKLLERKSQMSLADILPQYKTSLGNRLSRKAKYLGRTLKMKIKFKNLDFSNVIDRIIEIDKNEGLYFEYLSQPWFKNNIVLENSSSKEFWKNIFK